MKISSDGRIITMPLPIPIRNEVAEDLCSHPTRRAQSAPAHRHIDNAVKHAQKCDYSHGALTTLPGSQPKRSISKAIANITDMTDHDVTGDDAGSSKPSPDIFLRALDRLAPIGPSQTCVVGDTKYDGEAARCAGIPFLGVLCGGSSKEDLQRSGAIAIYRDPADLLAQWTCWRDFPSKRELHAAQN